MSYPTKTGDRVYPLLVCTCRTLTLVTSQMLCVYLNRIILKSDYMKQGQEIRY